MRVFIRMAKPWLVCRTEVTWAGIMHWILGLRKIRIKPERWEKLKLEPEGSRYRGSRKFFVQIRAGLYQYYRNTELSQLIGCGDSRRRCADDNYFLKSIFNALHDDAPVIPAAFFFLLFSTDMP